MEKIVSVFFTMLLCVSCTNRVYNSSNWQSNKVTVDGEISDWPNPLRFYDQNTGINYSISNDRYNLYFCCGITDEFLQTKILRSGLEFCIDTMGKKSFSVYFKYPVGNMPVLQPKFNSNPQPDKGSNAKPDRSSFRLKLLAEAREMQLVGFKPSLGKIITLSDANNTGISAAINFDKRGIMYYEAVIPFPSFYKNELTPSDSNKVFTYQIKVNPVSVPEGGYNRGGVMQGGGMRGSGMRGGGMRGGGMRGGGMGGGGMRGGSMRGNSSEMFGNNSGNRYQSNATMSGITKTTIKLRLAYKK